MKKAFMYLLHPRFEITERYHKIVPFVCYETVEEASNAGEKFTFEMALRPIQNAATASKIRYGRKKQNRQPRLKMKRRESRYMGKISFFK
jgi:7-keto-8-aminopelargonate synthetase-like enzyme